MSSVLQLVLIYAMFLTVLFACRSATAHVAVRADLRHIDSGRGFTKRDLLHRMAARTQARLDKRWLPLPRPRPSPSPSPSGANDTVVLGSVSRDRNGTYSEYVIHLSIGTPRPQRVALALDTGSDLIWTQCGCRSCFQQPFASLDTSASVTHRDYSCSERLCAWGGLTLSGCTVNENSCFYVYSINGDNSNSGFTSGKISEDTFTFQAPNGVGLQTVPSIRYGCGMYNTGNFVSNESGVAGFGRGPMSLPSQLKALKFSYCFRAIQDSGNSPLFLGSYGNLEAQAIGQVQSTPFAKGPTVGPNSALYYLSLKGVSVGNRRLLFDPSTFALRGNGSGGTVIDTGTAITSFPRAVFRTLRQEFISQVPTLNVADVYADPDSILCFSLAPGQNASQQPMPNLTLHLENADWELPRENYMLEGKGDGDDRLLCVVITSAGDSGGMTTVIGNFQQQNMHIAYDLGSNKLSFVRKRCDKL